jgi:hypothetical protein
MLGGFENPFVGIVRKNSKLAQRALTQTLNHFYRENSDGMRADTMAAPGLLSVTRILDPTELWHRSLSEKCPSGAGS